MGRRGIVIDKTFRHITFANPGTFPISPAEAIAGGISDGRNGRIFNMFALINVGERSGTGLCDLYHVWRENGFRPPRLVETVAPERVTLTLELVAEGNPRRSSAFSYGNIQLADSNIVALETNPWLEGGKLEVNEGKEEDRRRLVPSDPAS